MRKFAVGLIVSLLISVLNGAAIAQPDDDTIRNLIVTATGTVTAEPDMATVSLGVVTTGQSASDALDENSASMAEIIASLKRLGIADSDIQTSGLSVSPSYRRPDPRAPNRSSQPPEIVGYNVSNTVSVRIRDLPKIGALLDQIVKLGANTVSGPIFSVADSKPHQDAARKAAVAAARDEAQLYTEAAGVELGAIISIQNQGPPAPRPVMMAARSEALAGDVPIQSGELTFSANVKIIWEIR